MIDKDNEFFEVESLVGRDYLDLEKVRPPRSAKLVVDVSWSWSPAHSRYERYLICTDRHRTEWMLWTTWYNDEGRREYHRVACGTPYRGWPAKYAAEQLLKSAWRSELEQWETDLSGAYVDTEGLLTRGDIERIEQEVFGEGGGVRITEQRMAEPPHSPLVGNPPLIPDPVDEIRCVGIFDQRDRRLHLCEADFAAPGLL